MDKKGVLLQIKHYFSSILLFNTDLTITKKLIFKSRSRIATLKFPDVPWHLSLDLSKRTFSETNAPNDYWFKFYAPHTHLCLICQTLGKN